MPKQIIYLLSANWQFHIQRIVSKNLTLLSNFLTLFCLYFNVFAPNIIFFTFEEIIYHIREKHFSHI